MPNWAMARLEAPRVNPAAAAPMIGRVDRASDIQVLQLKFGGASGTLFTVGEIRASTDAKRVRP
jgi:hypothetical protein